MKILFDTNVVLDVMLDLEPFAEPASELMSLVESKKISGMLYYIKPPAMQEQKRSLQEI